MLKSWSEARYEGNRVFSSPLLPGQNRISTLQGWTVRVASGVIVAAEKVEILPCGAGGEESWLESLLEDAVVALEREEREEKFHFQMVDLGGSTAHFRFATRMAMVCVQVAA